MLLKEYTKMTRPTVSHYLQGGIEPIDFISSHNLNFNLGNIIKYATRCNYKGTKEADLKKVIHYAQFELEQMSKETKCKN